jgi:hypothetical protein
MKESLLGKISLVSKLQNKNRPFWVVGYATGSRQDQASIYNLPFIAPTLRDK